MSDISGIFALCESNARLLHTKEAWKLQIVTMRDSKTQRTVASVIATTATGISVIERGPPAGNTLGALTGLLQLLEVALGNWRPTWVDFEAQWPRRAIIHGRVFE